MAKHNKHLHSAEALFTVDRLRKVVAHLPEVEEAVDKFGHTSFRVRDKPFIMLGDGEKGAGMSIKSDHKTQASLIKSKRFKKTPYIGQHGWVSLLSMPPDDWDEITQLVTHAYKLAAPKTLARQLDT